MRVDKFIGNNTQLSRTQIHIALKQGIIRINETVISKTNAKMNEGDEVFLNNVRIDERKPRYLIMNKPAGYVCATADSEHPTVIDLIELPFKNELQLVGRLDRDTTGLLLITDDGQWNHRISSPKHNHSKSYLVTTASPIKEEAITLFSQGIVLHGETKPTLPAELEILSSNKARISICEGKYHQVKRMFAGVENHVVTLHRERIGALSLPTDLAQGNYRELTATEIAQIEN
jgi:16S rRNA pseudouridine516 synthase